MNNIVTMNYDLSCDNKNLSWIDITDSVIISIGRHERINMLGAIIFYDSKGLNLDKGLVTFKCHHRGCIRNDQREGVNTYCQWHVIFYYRSNCRISFDSHIFLFQLVSSFSFGIVASTFESLRTFWQHRNVFMWSTFTVFESSRKVVILLEFKWLRVKWLH